MFQQQMCRSSVDGRQIANCLPHVTAGEWKNGKGRARDSSLYIALDVRPAVIGCAVHYEVINDLLRNLRQ